eukprot:6179738-Pleurochrysis_carterae.AAC.2
MGRRACECAPMRTRTGRRGLDKDETAANTSKEVGAAIVAWLDGAAATHGTDYSYLDNEDVRQRCEESSVKYRLAHAEHFTNVRHN